jgi:ABC-type nickel/cobalt efflux system permease component RcnA
MCISSISSICCIIVSIIVIHDTYLGRVLQQTHTYTHTHTHTNTHTYTHKHTHKHTHTHTHTQTPTLGVSFSTSSRAAQDSLKKVVFRGRYVCIGVVSVYMQYNGV